MNVGYERRTIKQNDYTLHLLLDYFNERLRIENYEGDLSEIVEAIDEIQAKHFFTKIIFHSRKEDWQQLLCHGFELEAIFEGFFRKQDCYVMTYYLANNRRNSSNWVRGNEILLSVLRKQEKGDKRKPLSSYVLKKATIEDAQALASLYSQVFQVYPTPMNEAQYVQKMMEDSSIFYIVKHKNSIVSAASADVNDAFLNAEITDCVTLPDHRKYGLIKRLLHYLEEDLKKRGIYCSYSIARSLSYGMNAALYQLDYKYKGRLINNCYIFDKMEDMNVWVKLLSTD